MAEARGTSPVAPASSFAQRVHLSFSRRARHYDRLAPLQRSVAWRLGRLCRELPLPEGPCADLGAGSGLLSDALESQRPGLSMLRLDNCAELLREGDRAPERQGDARPPASLLWDLNRGLPGCLDGASLLTSSFALQWLERPAEQLEHWCRTLGPGGWLAVALPTRGSFPEWHRAARDAAVPCTALPLPAASELRAIAARQLILRHDHLLRFRHRRPAALAFLRDLKGLGAGATPARRRLSPAELQALESRWPAQDGLKSMGWEVLILVGQRSPEERR